MVNLTAQKDSPLVQVVMDREGGLQGTSYSDRENVSPCLGSSVESSERHQCPFIEI
jgi:hypothetical protein